MNSLYSDAFLSRMHRSSFYFTGPIQHENFNIQFLHGPSVRPTYLTLAEGCRLNIVEILVTGTVARLSAHNRSPKKPLFIQLGELLKGGPQDRTIATDLLLDPGEQYEGLSVYWVEQTRWSKRHEVDHKKFTSTQDFIATKPLRSSVEQREDQESVWEAVAFAKQKAGPANCLITSDRRSRPPACNSTWKIRLCKKSQSGISGGQRTSAARCEDCGVAIAIDYKLEKIEWYGHTRLFRRFWPGLLRAAILDALLEKVKSGKARLLDEMRFADLLGRLEQVKPRQHRPSAQTPDQRWQFASCHATRTTYHGWQSGSHG